MYMGFEDAMAKVDTIADTTQVPLNELQKSILALSNQTGISSSEIANNVYDAISAGQKTGDAVNFVANSSKLAKAGFAEAGDALDILTTIMNAYGLEADKVTDVSDMLIQTQNLGKTTVGQLASAMGKVIPTAKAQGVELDDLSGAYAVMTSNGIATAETTTYLNSMLNELGKQGTTASKAFAAGTEHIKEGGLTMKEAMDSGWELSDVLSILDEQAYETGTSISNMFGSAEAGKAASVLWDNADKLNDAVSQMRESAGATEIAFEKLQTKSVTIEKAVNQLKNTMIDLGGALMSVLGPIIESVAEKIAGFTQWFSGLSDGTKEFIVKIGLLAAAIGPVLVAVGKVVSAIGTIGGAISGVVGAVTSGIGQVMSIGGKLAGGVKALFALIAANPIAAAVVAVIAAFALLWANCEEFRNFFIGLWEGLKSAVSSFVEWFKNAWSGIKEFFSDLWQGVKETFSALGEWISKKAGEIVDWFKEKWEGIKDFFSELWESLKEAFTVFGEWVGEKAAEIVEFFKEAWNGLIEFFGELWEGIKEVFSCVAEFFGEVFAAAVEAISAAWSAVVEFFSGVWEGIKSIFSTVAEVLGGLFQAAAEAVQAAWTAVVEFFSGVWQGIQEIFASVAEVLGGLFQAAAEAVKNAWSAIVEFFQGVWEGIKNVFAVVAEVLGGFFRAAVDAIKASWEGITEFFQGVWQSIQDVFSTVAEVLGGFFEAAVEAIKEVWNGIIEFFQGIWEAIQEVFSNVAEFIGNTFEKAVDLVKKAWDGITSFFKGVVSKIVNVFSGLKSKFSSIGKNIVSGIKSGINAAWGALKDTVGNLVGGLVDWIKDLLGIASPSKVFAGIGKYMALGMGKGWEDEFGGIKRQIESGLNFGTASIGLNTRYGAQESTLSAPNAPAGTTVNIYSPVAVDPVQAAREWKKTTQRMAIGYV